MSLTVISHTNESIPAGVKVQLLIALGSPVTGIACSNPACCVDILYSHYPL
jgi:hypothetical protein